MKLLIFIFLTLFCYNSQATFFWGFGGGPSMKLDVVKCGQIALFNNSLFVNEDFPNPTDKPQVCRVTISKHLMVKQVLLELVKFDLNDPIDGHCQEDSLTITGINDDFQSVQLCGENSGQHLYFPVDKSFHPLTLTITTSGSFRKWKRNEGFNQGPPHRQQLAGRRWMIRIIQLEKGNPMIAPEGCLQHFNGTSNSFRSFNFPSNNLIKMNYAICIRREEAYCSLNFRSLTMSNPNLNNLNVNNPSLNITSRMMRRHQSFGPQFQFNHQINNQRNLRRVKRQVDIHADVPRYMRHPEYQSPQRFGRQQNQRILRDFEVPEFKFPQFGFSEFKVPDFKPEFKLPELKAPELFKLPKPEVPFGIPKFDPLLKHELGSKFKPDIEPKPEFVNFKPPQQMQMIYGYGMPYSNQYGSKQNYVYEYDKGNKIYDKIISKLEKEDLLKDKFKFDKLLKDPLKLQCDLMKNHLIFPPTIKSPTKTWCDDVNDGKPFVIETHEPYRLYVNVKESHGNGFAVAYQQIPCH